jgi:rSAM/selenodomain-associated transferase 1
MSRAQLFIMVKEPHPGRVKTRLGRDIGMTAAAWWFRHQSGSLIRRLGRDPRWQTVLAVSPDHEGLASRVWPWHLPRWPQGAGNLGHRMGRIFRRAPKGPVVIIGADIPGITPALIARAFAALGNHDAVFGPAPDGGYWLIGLKRGARPVPPRIFDAVRWSSATALADTKASLGTAKIALIDTLRDVDRAADLRVSDTELK